MPDQLGHGSGREHGMARGEHDPLLQTRAKSRIPWRPRLSRPRRRRNDRKDLHGRIRRPGHHIHGPALGVLRDEGRARGHLLPVLRRREARRNRARERHRLHLGDREPARHHPGQRHRHEQGLPAPLRGHSQAGRNSPHQLILVKTDTKRKDCRVGRRYPATRWRKR